MSKYSILIYWVLLYIILYSGVGVSFLPFWIAGKPAFFHSFLLFEKLLDGPERREADDAAQGAPEEVLHEQCGASAGYTEEQEHPPGLCAEVVFRLDYDWMKNTYDEKRCSAEQEALPSHVI